MPVHKWRIEKFSGKEEDLSRFLCTIRQLALATQTSEEELFQNRIYLLSGDVAEHLEGCDNVSTWQDVVRELTHFGMGTESNSDILRKIFTERQGDSSVVEFMKKLELWFQSLQNPLSEAEKVKVTLQGLKYSLRQALVSRTYHQWLDLKLAAKTTENLLKPEIDREERVGATENPIVKTMEKGRAREDEARAQVPSGQAEVLRRPQGNYQRPIQTTGRANVVGRTYEGRRRPQMNLRNERTSIRCFECGQEGHFRRECPRNDRGGSR